jgi:hypothetical protein
MSKQILLLAGALLSAVVGNANAADEPTSIFKKTNGDQSLATFKVDTAPGSVSAAALLGLSGDQLATIDNPRDLTVLVKTLDGGNALGISITPAKTAIFPMSVSTYNEKLLARIWTGTTFSYAQATATVNDKSYQQHAYSIDVSFYPEAALDDPFIVYWDSLRQAGSGDLLADNPCLMPAAKPAGDAKASPAAPAAGTGTSTTGPVKPAEVPQDSADAAQTAKRMTACRDKAIKSLRWNASKIWMSWATGRYKPSSGGNSSSLGRTLVLGGSLGIGDSTAKVSSLITAATKRVSHAPTLATYGDATPTTKDTNLTTLRIAVGSSKLRGLLEASNLRDGPVSSVDRTFKRALGVDLRISEGMWLNFRAGKQRRIDDKGDESGSSISLSYSPTALLSL